MSAPAKEARRGAQAAEGTPQPPPSSSSSGGGGGRQRYGPWLGAPASAAAPAGAGACNGGRGGRRGFTFAWPEYMERAELQQAMKRGSVFRAKFRVNASNRSEGFCTLEGLPSDLLVRGEVNQNRAVEGDEVAVLAFRLSDWFTVFKENTRLMEEGVLPQGAADPVSLADQLAQVALGSGDAGAAAAALSPWQAAGSPATALKVVGDLLRARPDLRVTGKVVSVIEPSPRREAVVGVLLAPEVALAAAADSRAGGGGGGGASPPQRAVAAALASGEWAGWLVLAPLDPRLPRGLVSPAAVAALPEALRAEAAAEDLPTRTFVTARVANWPAGSPLPHMEVRQSLGPTGDIQAGTAALLAAEGVLDQDFSLEAYACLPRTPWSISPGELAARADFTSWRVFSIDPITARDLDDALSIQPLPGGHWRLGVHIADVASFVKPGTPLDEEAQLRGTSVYLVQRVIPMLPRLLCEQLCSLQPGDPRFSFSVVWEVDGRGRVLREWAGRSVINSCGKLAYPMVQQMIEGCFDPSSWGVTLFHGVTWEQVTFDCLALHGVATHLRAARFAAGALRLNSTRLCFSLDTGGNPVSASPYVQSEANHLVEEFMLLANMRVAALIAGAFPLHAMLRRHSPPQDRKMAEFKAAAKLLGVEVSIRTSGELQASLSALGAACPDEATREVVTLLATKPMQLAQYFCTGESPEPASWRHFALAVNLYTHFTSPIRRYPDVVVHRLLQAAIDLGRQAGEPDGSGLLTEPALERAELPPPAGQPAEAAAASGEEEEGRLAALLEQQRSAAGAARRAAGDAVLSAHRLPSAEELERVAKHCNETKYRARMASDGSLRLFLCLMLKAAPAVTRAVVTALGGDRFFTVYLPEFGCETKMHLQLMGVPLAGSWDEQARVLTITAASTQQRQQQQRPGRQHLLLNSENFSLREWLEELPEGVVNSDRLQHAQLPLQLRVFSQLPVVVGTYINRITCCPEDVSAKLWLPCGAAERVVAAAAGAAAAAAVTAISYEALVED